MTYFKRYDDEIPVFEEEDKSREISLAKDDVETGSEVPELKTNRMKAIIFISLYSIGSVAVSTCFKLLSKGKGITVADFCMMRALVQFVASGSFLLKNSTSPSKELTGLWPTVIGHSSISMATQMGMKFAITLIPLAMAELIKNTNVFWTSVLAFFILKEKLMLFEIFSMFLAFGAILVMVITSSKSSSGADSISAIIFGCILMFGASWGQAGMSVLNRKMTNLHWSVIMFIYSFVGFAFSAVYMIIEALMKGSFTMHPIAIWGQLAAICIFDYFKVTAQLIAYQNDSPTFVSLFQQNVILYAFAADAFILNDALSIY